MFYLNFIKNQIFGPFQKQKIVGFLKIVSQQIGPTFAEFYFNLTRYTTTISAGLPINAQIHWVLAHAIWAFDLCVFAHL